MRKEKMTELNSISTGDMIFKRITVLFIVFFTGFSLLRAAGLKVESIQFEGNSSISTNELKKILKTKVGKPFDHKLLRFDRILLRNYYQQRGFLDIWVETKVNRKGEKISIIYQISEGKQFFLGGITITGNHIASSQELRKKFQIAERNVFLRQIIEDGLNNIEKFYFNNGKPYVILNTKERREDSLIYVTVEIEENETVYIQEIRYIGLKKVRKYIVRRELEIKEGDIYSREKIESSQKNIYSTGLFDYVGIELRAIDSTRTHVQLLVKVVEKRPRWVGLRFGVAYEQEAVYGGTFDFTLEFGHRNLFGSARTLYVNVIPSLSYDFTQNNIINPKNQYSLTYIEPWIGYTRTPGIFQVAYYQVRPINAADYDYFTSSLLIKHQFDKYWQTYGQLAFNRVKILEEDTLEQSFFQQTRGQDFIYSISQNLVRDSRDNYLNPQHGSVTDLTVKIAYSRSRQEKTGKISVNRFMKFVVTWNRYQAFPFQRKWVMASRFRAGNILEYGKKTLVPTTERFYLGGASTVRGYPEQLLGPVIYDKEGKPIQALGGKLFFLSNIELRIPLFWLIWGEVFIDAGNVWLEIDDFKFNSIKTTSGLGVALVTPLGPIRFDYGLKHQPEKNEPAGEFHISISFAF